MKVILRANVPGLGKAGETPEVSDGYARNYLLPKKLAVLATPKELINAQNAVAAHQRAERLERRAAQLQATSLHDVALVFTVPATDQGKLYAAITAVDISRALAARGHTVTRQQVKLPTPIKTVGTYELVIEPLMGITTKINLEIKPQTV